MFDFGLDGKAVVVSGGTSGIGLASAIALARGRAKVGIIGTNPEKMEAALKDVRAAAENPGDIVGVIADVTEAEAVRAAAKTIRDAIGPVWGLIASAGIAGASRAEDLPMEELNKVLSLNIGGVMLVCQAFFPQMIEQGSGSIVVIGSINSLGGQAARMHYTASKHAVVGMVKNMAIEWGHRGIRVNCIAPGPVDTPLLRRNVPKSFMESVFFDRIPIGRLARADELANSTLMLLSEASSYVNGAVLVVDGGMTAGPFTRRRGTDFGSNRMLEAGLYEDHD